MDTVKLRTFLVVADCLSFTVAAEQLYCSQPSVTMQIQALEKELDTKLFDRIGKRIYLTEQGNMFAKYAEQMVNIAKEAKEHLNQSEDLTSGKLSFGASHFVGVYMLTETLTKFHRLYPNINVNMQVTKSKQLIHKLAVNELELLVVSDQVNMGDSDYISKMFYVDELVLVARPDHWLAQEKEVQFTHLENETLLIKPENSATRKFLERASNYMNFTTFKHIEIGSTEGIKRGVLHGLGVSFLSRLVVKDEVNRGLLVEIPFPSHDFKRSIQYIYHKKKHLSPAIKEFIRMLDEETVEL